LGTCTVLSKILDIYDDDFPWPQYFEAVLVEKTENRLKINYKECGAKRSKSPEF